MSITPQQARQVLASAERLYDQAQVEAALDRMAAAIGAVLSDRDPLVLSVMNGALIPAGQLLPRLDFPLTLDYLHATRYQGQTRGGTLHWHARPRTPLRGRSVLVIDDIHDEGLTLAAIVDYCRAEGAEAVFTAVLVEKKHERKPPGFRVDFVGLEVPDRYVFGSGMDYKDYWRNAPGIFAVAQEHD